MGNSFETRNSSKSIKAYEPDNRQLLQVISQVKEHVVQIEAMAAYLLVCVIVMNILGTVVEITRLYFLLWLVPSLFLIGLRLIVRVTNPESSTRNRVVWASVFTGIGGTLGAGVDIISHGLTGGYATFAGAGLGATIGGAFGNWIENLGGGNKLLERGEAFKFLYENRKKNPRIANSQLIDEALNTKIQSHDINNDGRPRYTMEDLKAFVASLLPVIQNIIPTTGEQNQESDLTIIGKNFRSPQVLLVRGAEQMVATVISSVARQIRCKIRVDKMPDGKWDVIVLNEDGGQGKLAEVFQITADVGDLTNPY